MESANAEGEKMKVIDMTRTIHPGMPIFPGDPEPEFRAMADCERDGFRERVVTLASHTGTHMDAPAHVIPRGTMLDAFPPSRFCGTAVCVPCESAGEGGTITLEMIRSCRGADEAEFLLLRTGWEDRWGTESYFAHYPVLSDEAARWIASARKKGVGLDVMSPDPLDDASLALHHILLGGGTLIVENLCSLRELPEGIFRFCALPLKLQDADGAPARAVAFIE